MSSYFKKRLAFISSVLYNIDKESVFALILGWSKDPGPPSGGGIPRYFFTKDGQNDGR